MSQETIYKAQEKALMQSNRNRPALGLIVGGLGLLALTLSGVALLELVAPLLFVGGFGALLMWPAYQTTADSPKRGLWLAGPGALFLTIGSLVFVLGLIDHFEAMAYAWTMLPMAFVAGLMYGYRHDEQNRIHVQGPKIMRVLGWMFVGLGLFFELLVFESLGPWWPLALVIYGVYLLFQTRKQAKETAM